MPLPRCLSTIPDPELAAVLLQCGDVNDLDHALNAVFDGSLSLLVAQRHSTKVAEVSLNPTT
jgi:hypothetical protein